MGARALLVALGVAWAAFAPAAEATPARAGKFPGPRNIVHGDLLGYWAGERLLGANWERFRREDTGFWSYVWGVRVAWDLEVEPLGNLDVSEMDLDVIALGFQWRYYGDAMSGLYGFASGSLLVAEGSGETDAGRTNEYVYTGLVPSLFGLGYQVVAARLALDLSASFVTPSLGYFFQRSGGDDGFGGIGGYGILLAGGIGVGF